MGAEGMGEEPVVPTAAEEHGSLQELALQIDANMAMTNPIDGAIVLAAMDEELSDMEAALHEAQERRAALQQRKTELETEREQAGSVTVCIIGAVDVEELEDDEDYEAAVDDITEGCSRSGEVTAVHIPRPGQDPDVLIGRAFVMFSKPAEARAAVASLDGKKLGDKRLRAAIVSDVLVDGAGSGGADVACTDPEALD